MFEMDYHIGLLGSKEKTLLLEVLKNLEEQNPKKYQAIKESMVSLNLSFEDVFLKLLRAQLKSFRDRNLRLDESDQIEYLWSCLDKNLPFAVEVEKKISIPSSYLYEPLNSKLFLLADKLPKVISLDKQAMSKLSSLKKSQLLLLSSYFRTFRSSMLLFAMGDDVHGYGLVRGMVELLARSYGLNETNVEDYLFYGSLNRDLQKARMKQPVSARLSYFMESKALTLSSSENYFLYGWYTVNHHPILSATDLIHHVFDEKLAEKYLEIYHFSSEFLHEDIEFVQYDFISLRNKMDKVFLQMLFQMDQKFHLSNLSEEIKRLMDSIQRVQ
jgi:hypothetical protein